MDYLSLIDPGDLLDTGVSYLYFTGLHSIFEKDLTRNMANNFTAFSHAIGASVLGFYYLWGREEMLYYILKKHGTGYFLYDMIHILKYGKRNKLNAIYLYHHLTSIYILHQDPLIYRGGEILFLAELSNIPSYIVYYLLKNKLGNGEKLKLMKKVQFFTYTIIRWPIMGYMFIKSLMKAKNKNPFFAIIPVYIMGLFWSYNLWKNL